MPISYSNITWLISTLLRTPWGVNLRPVPRKTVEKSEQEEEDLIALQKKKLGTLKKRNVVIFYFA
jgi:hypothetical protein